MGNNCKLNIVHLLRSTRRGIRWRVDSLYYILSLLSVCAVLIFATNNAKAQYYLPENRIWALGIFAGLDFNSGQPVPIKTAVSGAPNSNGHTGMASVAVSDRNGQLLFYTNGSHIWNRNHDLVLPSPLHPGALTLTPVTQVTSQGTLVVPVLGNPDQYYIFSLTHPGNHAPVSVSLYGKLYYSVFDMQLNGGLGGVVPGQQWQLLGVDLADKMLAIPGENCNAWLLVHEMENNRFLAFEINGSGISTTPVVSAVGSTGSLPAAGGRNQYWIDGQMAVSPDFKKIAICATFGSFIELFDFNAATGQVSNPIMLDSGQLAYGLAFSAESSKLYAIAQDASSPTYSWHLFQFDMNAGSPASIRASKTKVSKDYLPRTQLKLGPDKRIYFGAYRNPINGIPGERGRQIGALMNPEASGSAAGYIPLAVELLDSTSMVYGLSHEVTRIQDSIFSKTPAWICVDQVELKGRAGHDSYEWQDGSVASTYLAHSAGIYWVRSRKGCVVYIDSFEVKAAVEVSLGNDTVVCLDPQPITLRPQTDKQISSYLWSDGSEGRILVVRKSGRYWVKVTTTEGCIGSDTVDIVLTHLQPDLGADTVICLPETSSFELSVELSDAAEVKWSTGSDKPQINIIGPGEYWVELTEGTCVARDTIVVEFIDLSQNLGSDKLLCREEPFEISLNAVHIPEGATVLWSDGSVGIELWLRDTGIYWLEVSYAQCTSSDTIAIHTEYCDCAFAFPTAFTPNGDGKNDYFKMVVNPDCVVDDFDLAIYNRWGAVVFSSNQVLSGWDGKFNGMDAEQGVYMYRANFTVGTEKHKKEVKGDITLIR